MKYQKENSYMYLVYIILWSSFIYLTVNFSSRNLQFNDPNCNIFQSNGFC
jgi:hypothetical protein